jgi:hypothetical protein
MMVEEEGIWDRNLSTLGNLKCLKDKAILESLGEPRGSLV